MISYFKYNTDDDKTASLTILILEDDPNGTRMPKFKKVFSTKDCFIYWTDTAKDCIYLLEKVANGSIKLDFMFLDHDLGGKVMTSVEDNNTGSEVARWFSAHPEVHDKFKDTSIVIHSFNPDGAEYMTQMIPNSRYIPGVWDKLS